MTYDILSHLSAGSHRAPILIMNLFIIRECVSMGFAVITWILIGQRQKLKYCLGLRKFPGTKNLFELFLNYMIPFEIFKSVEIWVCVHRFLFEFPKYIGIDCRSLYIYWYTLYTLIDSTCVIQPSGSANIWSAF